MRRLAGQKRGQFVMIAVLTIAIMIVSMGVLMHRTVTYYKNEPWEEYLTLIGNIELDSRRLMELSLANFTNSEEPNPDILKTNLENWQSDLARIYPGFGITLTIDSSNIVCSWNRTASYSTADANLALNITSIGLRGHRFPTTVSVGLRILGPPIDNRINVTVTNEDGNPIKNLKIDNFQITNLNISSVTLHHYNETYPIIYTIKCSNPISAPATVMVWDYRGIQVIAQYP